MSAKTIHLYPTDGYGWQRCKKDHPIVWFRGPDCPVCVEVEVREIVTRPVPSQRAFLEVTTCK